MKHRNLRTAGHFGGQKIWRQPVLFLLCRDVRQRVVRRSRQRVVRRRRRLPPMRFRFPAEERAASKRRRLEPVVDCPLPQRGRELLRKNTCQNLAPYHSHVI